MLAQRLEGWAEPEWERKEVALWELKAEGLEKLMVGGARVLLTEDAADRAPAEESELKELVKTVAEEEEQVSVLEFLEVAWKQVLGQKAARELETAPVAGLSKA